MGDGDIGVIAGDILRLEEGQALAVVATVVHIVGQVAQVILVADFIGIRAGRLEDAKSGGVAVGDDEADEVSIGLQRVAGAALLGVVVVRGGRAAAVQ